MPGQAAECAASPGVPGGGPGCDASGRGASGYRGTAEALAAVRSGLDYLAAARAGSLPAAELAECLRMLERAESVQTVARANVLAAFAAQEGYEFDGQGGARSWLAWQTRITRASAATAMAWVRRLGAHPAVCEALAAAELSASWARQICSWSDQLPADLRGHADQILLGAAAGGARLGELAGLAEEMHRRCAPDGDDDGFAERSVQLDIHWRGAGRLTGDLTPECAAALSAVLDALGKPAGPEDDRSRQQRQHDALEEACRRLIGAGCLPDRAGQPTQVQLHVTLDQLLDLANGPTGGAAGEPADPRDGNAAGVAETAAGAGEPGWLQDPAAALAYSCDAQVTPMVVGHADPEALSRLAASVPPGTNSARCHDTLLRFATEVLSGPAGLAAQLRDQVLGRRFPAVSLPLDVGTATDQIPPHLRRAVIARDRHCAFAGCTQPPAACQVHHIIPRSEGGPTALPNLLVLCSFHHLVAIHRWGWRITLHGDGTTTAVSPDGCRVLHSHSPPAAVGPDGCRSLHSHSPPAAAAA